MIALDKDFYTDRIEKLQWHQHVLCY